MKKYEGKRYMVFDRDKDEWFMVDEIMSNQQIPSQCNCEEMSKNYAAWECPIHGVESRKSPTPPQEDKESWEERLELLFCKPWGTKEVKQFISSLLKEERQKHYKIVKEKLLKMFEGTEANNGEVKVSSHNIQKYGNEILDQLKHE